MGQVTTYIGKKKYTYDIKTSIIKQSIKNSKDYIKMYTVEILKRGNFLSNFEINKYIQEINNDIRGMYWLCLLLHKDIKESKE